VRNAVYFNSNADAASLKEPVLFPERTVESTSNSFSPAAPMSLPSMKPNRCSVSTSPPLAMPLPPSSMIIIASEAIVDFEAVAFGRRRRQAYPDR
jgi:hypothetical protein